MFCLEIKNICLTLFKEPISAGARVGYWKEYVALSNEIKSLKNRLNEQTTFEVEQIDLEINSIEGDLKKYEVVMQAMSEIEIDNKIKEIENASLRSIDYGQLISVKLVCDKIFEHTFFVFIR